MTGDEWLLERDLRACKQVLRITIPGEPVSKGRPRFSKQGHAYTPTKTKDAESRIAWAVKAANKCSVDSESTFGVTVKFFNEKRTRRDVDNMLKLVCDALTGIVWADDAQVTEMSAGLQRGVHKDSARTCILIYETVLGK